MKKHQYIHECQDFNFNEIKADQSTRKEKVKVFQESIEIKFEHVYQQLMNDIYEKIEDGESLNIDYIQSRLVLCLLGKFNKTNTAKIMGVSDRTIGNYVNKYGYKNIQQDKKLLH